MVGLTREPSTEIENIPPGSIHHQAGQTSIETMNHHSDDTKLDHINQLQDQTTLPHLIHRVGYWWSEKKAQKFNPVELTALFEQRQCELVKIDLERSLEDQGPFSVIVHKLSDILVKADQGDQAATKVINAFQSYVRKNPQTVVLDPLDNNRSLLDRYKQYRLIEQSGLAKEGVVFTPPFVHLTSTNIDVNRGRIRRSKLTFPLVCKPTLAQGSTVAHQMSIIFNEAGLKDVKPPCVAQSFINHNAKLFKVFVIKDKYYIMERPSLKNFQAGDQETVFFFSHDISKPNSSSSLTELDETDKLRLQDLMSRMTVNAHNQNYEEQQHTCNIPSQDYNNQGSEYAGVITNGRVGAKSISVDEYHDHEDRNNESHIDNKISSDDQKRKQLSGLTPSKEKLDKIVQEFSEKLGLTFYGLDVIIEDTTSRYAIIDMNTFPGYDGVEDFLPMFRDVVCDTIPDTNIDSDQLQQLKLSIKVNKRKPNEVDSGIEST